jgi:FtsH-binding integral membrane protein
MAASLPAPLAGQSELCLRGAAGHTMGVMSETISPYYADARPRAIPTTQLLAQVMFLVAVALGFCALGTLLGRDLSLGTARICSFAGFGMLLVASFAGARFRVGGFAMGWLFATALLIGLGLGPVIAYFSADAIWLATGIFVSIVNIFLSLLNISSAR